MESRGFHGGCYLVRFIVIGGSVEGGVEHGFEDEFKFIRVVGLAFAGGVGVSLEE